MELEGIFQSLVEKLEGWIEAFILMLPNMAAALAVLLLFWLVARGVRSVVGRVMGRVSS